MLEACERPDSPWTWAGVPTWGRCSQKVLLLAPPAGGAPVPPSFLVRYRTRFPTSSTDSATRLDFPLLSAGSVSVSADACSWQVKKMLLTALMLRRVTADQTQMSKKCSGASKVNLTRLRSSHNTVFETWSLLEREPKTFPARSLLLLELVARFRRKRAAFTALPVR